MRTVTALLYLLPARRPPRRPPAARPRALAPASASHLGLPASRARAASGASAGSRRTTRLGASRGELRTANGAWSRAAATTSAGTSRCAAACSARARMRIAVEEHGGGRQLLRFRIWPRCSRIGLALVAPSSPRWPPLRSRRRAASARRAGSPRRSCRGLDAAGLRGRDGRPAHRARRRGRAAHRRRVRAARDGAVARPERARWRANGHPRAVGGRDSRTVAANGRRASRATESRCRRSSTSASAASTSPSERIETAGRASSMPAAAQKKEVGGAGTSGRLLRSPPVSAAVPELVSCLLALTVLGAIVALAEPWPLAIVIDNVIGSNRPRALLQPLVRRQPGPVPAARSSSSALGFLISMLSHGLRVINDYVNAKRRAEHGADLRSDLFEPRAARSR